MPSRETENALPVVVILTAIPVEYLAVEAYLNDIKEDKAEDGTIYGKGVFCSDGQEWTVVVRDIGEGNTRAANDVTKAFNRYHPEVMLFCGIAGGIKDVSIGDVVVATKVYSCESGKGEEDFRLRPELSQPTYIAIEQAKAEAKKTGWLNRLWYRVCSVPSEPPPYHKVQIKPIASVAQVVASSNADMIKRIKKYYNDAIAVEMEGFGFLQSCHQYPEMNSLVVRGISDLLDDKSETDIEGSQEIAATSAAAFTFQVLSSLDLHGQRKKEYFADVRPPEKRDETKEDEKARIAESDISEDEKSKELLLVDHFRKELKKRGVFGIGVEERVRLFVLAGSLLPYNIKFRELGNHLLHRMYLNRENEDLTPKEDYLIYTTLLRDSWDRKTGWFWLRKLRSKRIVELLENDASSKIGDDQSRKGAIRILQILEPSKAEVSLVKIVQECEHEQKRSILDYLCAYGSRKTLDVVEELTVGQHEGVTCKAIMAKIGILSRYDPAQAVKIMVEEATRDPKICEEAALEKIVSRMSTRNLRKLAAANYLYSFRELAKRGRASEAELNSMLQSFWPEILYFGYSALLKRGAKFDPVEIRDKWPKSRGGVFGFFGAYHKTLGEKWLEKAVLESYLNMPMSELEGSVELKYQRGIAYLAWGLSGGCSAVEVIRNDIKNNFKRHKFNLLAGIEEEINRGPAENQQRKESLQNSDRSMTIELMVSALKVLKKYGNASDKVIAKTFLKSGDAQVRASAVDLFAKYAGKKDIAVLSEISSSGDVEGRIVAAKRILKLNAGKKRIQDLLESSYSDVVKETIFWYIANKERLDWSEMSTLLCSKNDDIRLLATAYAVKTWTRQKLVSLLKRYLSGETYYYDVVCWLDRVLYAPRNLAQGYKKKLIERFD